MRIILASAVVAAAAIALTPPANADHHVPASGRVTNCVTTTEYSRIAIGMERADIEGILDGPGRRDHLNTNRHFAARIYRACGKPLSRQRIEVFYSRHTMRVDDVWRVVSQDGTLNYDDTFRPTS